MRYSKLFGKTIKSFPKDVVLTSHKLLYQAGYIRESTAGRYYLLPLGLRVQQKIQKIVKEEMDALGAQELITPVLHPKILWKETNRTNSVGFELMSIKDRNEMEFVLGGTAEEMLVDLVRKFQLSYKDLPFNLYQFSTKFRDELRARGGLLRLREFLMKDAYSFHASEEDFKQEYQRMMDTYTKIFRRIGLHTTIVESDNGYIGGEYCHEFVVESPIGESKFLTTKDNTYAKHEEIATFDKEVTSTTEEMQELVEVDAVRGTSMEDGAALHKKPLWQQIKDVVFVDEKGRFILAIIRGDYDVNEVKLLHLVKSYTLRHATEEEIRSILHSEPGFISPVGIKDIISSSASLLIVADDSLGTIRNAYGGSNKKNRDLLNINKDRDYTPDLEGDIALAKPGYMTKGEKLMVKKGIEVGNIFQLGFHYSSKMKGANFIGNDGLISPYYMGCYGIGLARTLAAVVEIHNDEYGMCWPKAIAPYAIHLVGLSSRADKVYEELISQGIDVLYDDRLDIHAGEKFHDADLIGIPFRVVVGTKQQDKVEFKKRQSKETLLISVGEVIEKVKAEMVA